MATSCRPRVSVVNEMLRPSGAQRPSSDSPSTPPRVSRRSALPPDAATTYRSAFVRTASRRDSKSRSVPSGDQRGCASSRVPSVNACFVPVATSITCTAKPLPPAFAVYARLVPSGDHAMSR